MPLRSLSVTTPTSSMLLRMKNPTVFWDVLEDLLSKGAQMSTNVSRSWSKVTTLSLVILTSPRARMSQVRIRECVISVSSNSSSLTPSQIRVYYVNRNAHLAEVMSDDSGKTWKYGKMKDFNVEADRKQPLTAVVRPDQHLKVFFSSPKESVMRVAYTNVNPGDTWSSVNAHEKWWISVRLWWTFEENDKGWLSKLKYIIVFV